MMNLASRIERYLRLSGMPATLFGREVLRDPSFVRELRNGRCPREDTVARLVAWLDAAERERRAP